MQYLYNTKLLLGTVLLLIANYFTTFMHIVKRGLDLQRWVWWWTCTVFLHLWTLQWWKCWFAGLATVEAYNAKANEWFHVNPMNTRRSSVGVGVVGGQWLPRSQSLSVYVQPQAIEVHCCYVLFGILYWLNKGFSTFWDQGPFTYNTKCIHNCLTCNNKYITIFICLHILFWCCFVHTI